VVWSVVNTTMDELRRLEHLSLVSKVCTELDNHYSMNDKDLSEFIIDLASKNPTLTKFRAALLENGAEFADSFIENLLRIIQHMAPGQQGGDSQKPPKLALLREQLPCLAIPDKKVEMEEKVKVAPKAKEAAVDNMMEFLESMAPSQQADEEFSKKPKKKKRSRSRDRSKERKRSRSRERKRSRDRRRSRSRSRDRDRDRRRRSRSNDDRRGRGGVEQARKVADRVVDKDEAEQFKIYSGKVQNITNFGCFVQLMGFRRKVEGLVHISQLRREGRVTSVEEVVARGDTVRVKVLSTSGGKTSLSMKDVDQTTGEDLNPTANKVVGKNGREEDLRMMNPERPVDLMDILPARAGLVLDDENEFKAKKKVTRISSPEKWELEQMIKANVIDKSELPDFDEETGLLHKVGDYSAGVVIEMMILGK
jgi:ATP-dependent RNA helicase DHX8/PRP22